VFYWTRHTTTPHMAWGVGLAVEDALVLAELLGAGVTAGDIAGRVSERRFARCKLVVHGSLQLSRSEREPETPGADPGRLLRATFAAVGRADLDLLYEILTATAAFLAAL
jgi:2-polyprenyl-6-methoxyphenol hydroxylase-like FAD-dependent oxidoreductase